MIRGVATTAVTRSSWEHRVLLAAQVSAEVNTAMILVQNLLAPPATLLRPAMMLRVWRAAKRTERSLAAGRSTRRQPLPSAPDQLEEGRHEPVLR